MPKLTPAPLCIGGPWAGRYHAHDGYQFTVVERPQMTLEPDPEPGESFAPLRVREHRYYRQTIYGSHIWAAEGMRWGDIVKELFDAYAKQKEKDRE